MNREEFVDWVNSLENNYPINEWRIEGVHVWPLIKVKLLFYSGKSNLKKSKGLSKWAKLFKSFIGTFSYINLTLKSKSNSPTSFFCIAPHFRFLNNNKVYLNRYYNQSINEILNSGSQDFRIFDYGESTTDYKDSIDFPKKTIFLGTLKYFALMQRDLILLFKGRKNDWPRFEDFISDINDKIGPNLINANSITRQFVYIEKLKNIYTKLLLKHNVTEVYILCYYVSEMYAMALASNKLGISSCDIQHGGQGNLHLAYSGFNKIPENGYNLLPKKFWVWDKASFVEIQKWVSKQKFHEVFVKGNPWIEYCIQEFSSEIITNRKIILYTMQPIGSELLDKYIIEAIKETPMDYIWWLRLHPRQLQSKTDLKNYFETNGLKEKVNIDDAINLPLPAILSKCHVHLSKFSGSILEAYMMKVKSIIISDIGVKSFPEVVKTEYGLIHLEKDSDILLNQIVNLNLKNEV